MSVQAWPGLLLWAIIFYHVSAQNTRFNNRYDCSARGISGSCSPLQLCNELDRQFRNANREELQSLIQRYGCGFRQSVPYVCCPQDYGKVVNPQPPNYWGPPKDETTKRPVAPSYWGTRPTPTDRPGDWAWSQESGEVTRPTSKATRKPATSAPQIAKPGHRNRRLLPEETCGISIGEKILGGTTAGIDEFPWMGLLQYTFSTGRTTFGCGASLITAQYVLTAAHCIKGPDIPNNLKVTRVRLGEFDTSKARDCQGEKCAPQPQDIEIETIIVHKDYEPDKLAQYNDIALIRLKKPAQLNNYVSPICLPMDAVAKNNYEGQKLVVAGWGRTRNERGSSSDTKQRLSIPVVSMSSCSPFYSRNNIQLRGTQMCAGGEKGKDSCAGDSGGPLMSSDTVDSQVRWHVTGVVSFGPMICGKENVAAVYTKVAEYTNWILDNMKD